jgi:hypothetical protein
MAVELELLPDSFVATREGLHRVAEQLVAPARKPHNEIALRPTPGGFGTPEFEFERRRTQVRMEGIELVLTRDHEIARAPLRSLAAGGALLGAGLTTRRRWSWTPRQPAFSPVSTPSRPMSLGG